MGTRGAFGVTHRRKNYTCEVSRQEWTLNQLQHFLLTAHTSGRAYAPIRFYHRVCFTPPDQTHFLKSIGCLHLLQVCSRLNSSEKISFSVPHCGHLQVKSARLLNVSNPGQCCGVVIRLPPVVFLLDTLSMPRQDYSRFSIMALVNLP